MSTGMVCAWCGVLREVSAFKFDAKRQRYRAACRICCNERARAKYAHDQEYRAKQLELAAERRARRVPLDQLSHAEAEAVRDRRRKAKRLGRLCARSGYKPVRLDAHVHEWRAEMARRERRLRPQLHDEHVRLAARNSAFWWHVKDKHRPSVAPLRRARRQAERDGLSDAYITRLFTGGRKSDPIAAGIPRALVDLKRAHMELRRYLKQHEGDDHEECNATSQRSGEGV